MYPYLDAAMLIFMISGLGGLRSWYDGLSPTEHTMLILEIQRFEQDMKDKMGEQNWKQIMRFLMADHN